MAAKFFIDPWFAGIGDVPQRIGQINECAGSHPIGKGLSWPRLLRERTDSRGERRELGAPGERSPGPPDKSITIKRRPRGTLARSRAQPTVRACTPLSTSIY